MFASNLTDPEQNSRIFKGFAYNTCGIPICKICNIWHPIKNYEACKEENTTYNQKNQPTETHSKITQMTELVDEDIKQLF